MAVLSRTDHGQITPQDWFSAGGSESGYIALDPEDPNIVYVSWHLRRGEPVQLAHIVQPGHHALAVTNWHSEIVERKYRDPWTPVLLFSPFDKQDALSRHAVRDENDGWWACTGQTISPDLTGATQTEDKRPEGPPTVENSKQRGYGVVYTIAPSGLNGRFDLGRQRYRPDSPYSRWRQDMERRNAERAWRLEQNFVDRGFAL